MLMCLNALSIKVPIPLIIIISPHSLSIRIIYYKIWKPRLYVLFQDQKQCTFLLTQATTKIISKVKLKFPKVHSFNWGFSGHLLSFFYLDFALFSSCFQHNIIIFLNARLSFSLASGWRQNINPNQMLPHFVSKSTKLSRTKWGTKFSTVANIRKCCVSIRCQLCFQGVLMVALPEIRVSWQCCFLSYDFLSNLAYRAALSMSD